MKKLLLLFLLMSAVFARADNYFTMGENGYFRINPAKVGDYYDEYQLDAADVNGDGDINYIDVNILINYLINQNS